MHKLIIFILLMVSLAVKAENPLTFQAVDSITYQYFLTGDWDKLIETGEQAIAQNIDFMRLRQRMGYAYFVKADYYASQKQYEKALAFDESDPDTREYLYYCGLYNGDVAYSRYSAGKLSPELKTRLGIGPFNPIASVDLEYNYKSNNSSTRSNPAYFRGGLFSQVGYRLSLYQSVSNYKQTVDSIVIKQPDYFGLVNWSITSHTSLSFAYHYLNTSLDGNRYPGSLVFTSVETRLNRFSLGLNGSFFRYDLGDFKQVGLHAGVTLPGKSSLYFSTFLSGLIEQNNQRLIYAQYAGARVYKSLWAEGVVILGNIQNYNDHNSLYVYNSIDPTLFRTGLTLYWHLGQKITLYGNYLYDIKQEGQTTSHYVQHSFLGGIIWKP